MAASEQLRSSTAFVAVHVVVALTLIVRGGGVNGFGQRSIDFNAVRSTYNTNYLTNFSLYTLNHSLYVHTYLRRTLNAGLRAHIDVQLRLTNSKNYQTLFTNDVDVCMMVTSFKGSLFKKWFRSASKYGNFMDNCPVNTGTYYLNGFKLESNLIPAYLYPGDYRILGHLYYGTYKGKNEESIVDGEVDSTVN